VKRYQSHKIVEAGQVADLEDVPTGFIVHLADGEKVPCSRGVFWRGFPVKGDYLVRYEDGYISWSPRHVFEAGYSPTT
jgi:hypothetical protein